MKKLILSIILLGSIISISAQDFLLSEQWFSRINRNPAATGNSADVNLFYMHRSQWVGFDDAPRTNLLNAHAFFEGISSGVGLVLMHDKLGVGTKSFNAKAAYAYHTPIAKNMLLSFGVSAGVLNKSFDPEKLQLPEGAVPNPADDSKTSFDMDLGIEFSMPVFMAGFSVSHLLDDRKDATNVSALRQFTGYARGNIRLADKFNLAPGVVYNNYSKAAPSFFEVNATLFYNKLYWFGIGTRFDDEVNFTTLNAIIGLEWKMLRIGYGYDFSVGDLGQFKKNTHEVMLSLKIPTGKEKKTTQRFVRFME